MRVTVRTADEHGHVARARQLRVLAIGRDGDAQERGHLFPVLTLHERVQPLDDLRWRVPVEGICLERGSKLSHQCGRANATTDHVAHREDDTPVAEVEHVEPVAPHLGARPGRQVAERHVHARDLRKPLGEQTALQRLGDVPLLLEAAGAVDGERHPVTHELEQRRVVFGELPHVASADEQDTEELTVKDERYAEHGVHAQACEERLHRAGRVPLLQPDGSTRKRESPGKSMRPNSSSSRSWTATYCSAASVIHWRSRTRLAAAVARSWASSSWARMTTRCARTEATYPMRTSPIAANRRAQPMRSRASAGGSPIASGKTVKARRAARRTSARRVGWTAPAPTQTSMSAWYGITLPARSSNENTW